MRQGVTGPVSIAPNSEHDYQASQTPTPVAAVRGATSMLRDLGAIGGGRLASVAISAVTMVITTRVLGPSGYGTVAIVGILATLIFSVSTAWTGISVRRYGREDLELRGTMRRLTWNRAVIGGPLMAACILLILTLEGVGALPRQLTWPLVWIGIGTGIAMIIVDQFVCLLETSGQMTVSAVAQVLSQGAYAASLLVLFGLRLHVSPGLVLILSLGSIGALAIAVAPRVWRIGVGPPAVDRQLLRRMLWLSSPMVGLVVSQYVFASVDIVVLRAFRGQVDAGVYAAAYKVYSVLSAVAMTPNVVLVPLFVSLQVRGRMSLIERYLRDGVPEGLFIVSVCGGSAVALLPLLVPVAFGHAFAAAGPPVAVLMVGITFLFGAYLVVPILDLKEQTRAGAGINIIAAVINVVGDVLLIGVLHMGVIAPAIATSAALVFSFLAMYVWSRRVLGVRYWPDPRMVLPLVAGLAPVVTLSGVAGGTVGIVATIVTSLAIAKWHSPFKPEDADVIDKLDMPPIVRRFAHKALTKVT